jgi:hypothetical protein
MAGIGPPDNRRLLVENIQVADLPEPVARAIEAMVEVIRKQLGSRGHEAPPKALHIPLWEGTVIGHLTREEIYDDAR